ECGVMVRVRLEQHLDRHSRVTRHLVDIYPMTHEPGDARVAQYVRSVFSLGAGKFRYSVPGSTELRDRLAQIVHHGRDALLHISFAPAAEVRKQAGGYFSWRLAPVRFAYSRPPTIEQTGFQIQPSRRL